MPGTNDITYISIHAPRMGSDMRRANSSPRRPISIHAPRMGSDLPGARGHLRRGQISIHAPRMGSDAVFAMPQVWWRISIHAPRMGSDPAVWVSIIATLLFQSTLPGWGATRHGNVEHHRQVISIHAPRMGSDRKGNRLRSRHSKFQSTLPGWGATGVLFEHIQAHNHFNPRSPDGERLFQPVLEDDGTDISIHAPRMGSDLKSFADCLKPFLFQSTLPGWGATPNRRALP